MFLMACGRNLLVELECFSRQVSAHVEQYQVHTYRAARETVLPGDYRPRVPRRHDSAEPGPARRV